LRNHFVICVSVVVGILIVACGSGSDDPQEIDKATFTKQANEICQRATGRLAAQVGSMSTKAEEKPDYDYTKDQTVIVKEALIPNLEEELREIRALGIPAEARKDTEAFLVASQKVIDWLKARPQALIEGQVPPYAKAEVAGTKFGVTECPFAAAKPS
jgi:hypothetical protein